MLRAPHHALGLVQSMQWVTVGHVVAAAAVLAQASDDNAAQILSLAPRGTLCNRLSICFYRPLLVILSPGFSHSCLSGPSFCLIYSAALCSLIHFFPFVSLPKSVVLSSLLFLFLCLYTFAGVRRMHFSRITISDFLCPQSVRPSER